MTFPSVSSVGSGVVSSPSVGTSLVVTIPACNAGDRLIVFALNQDGFNTFTWPGSPAWTSGAIYNATVDAHLEIRYRDVTGTEGWGSGSTITLTMASDHRVFRTFRLLSGTYDPATAPFFNTGTQNSSTSPDPGNCAPGWGALDILWIAGYAYNQGQRFNQGSPSGYGSTVTDRADTATAMGMTTATRNLNASSENAGAFTFSNNDAWVAFTIANKPSVATPRSQSIIIV